MCSVSSHFLSSLQNALLATIEVTDSQMKSAYLVQLTPKWIVQLLLNATVLQAISETEKVFITTVQPLRQKKMHPMVVPVSLLIMYRIHSKVVGCLAKCQRV